MVGVFFLVACYCSPQGSLNVSCSEFGECNCKFGVLGIKCDSCAENKHNLTAGCIGKYFYNNVTILVQYCATILIQYSRSFETSSLLLAICWKPGVIALGTFIHQGFDFGFEYLRAVK